MSPAKHARRSYRVDSIDDRIKMASRQMQVRVRAHTQEIGGGYFGFPFFFIFLTRDEAHEN